MNLITAVIISLSLCIVYYFMVLTFPETYKRNGAKKPINSLLLVSIIVYFIAIAILLWAKQKQLILYTLDLKIALLLIPVNSITLFSINIYYPAIRLMLKYNMTNADFLSQLGELIFQYKYSNSEERLKVIDKLKDFNSTFSKQLKDYRLDFYIEKLLLLSNSITNKAPEPLINWMENYTLQLQIEINDESPQPFSTINLVASFCFSSLLTVLLAFVSVIE